jgi:DNA-directed RNA polymerase II subunit RPB1
MTLNTFHFAGVASKSNVTRGVPRIDEILTLTENPKNPSLTVYLKEDEEHDNQYAQEMMYKLEYTNMRQIVKSVKICFDPKLKQTHIKEDEEFLKQYNEFQSFMNECAGVEEEELEYSKWIIRFELDREIMLDKNINVDDVHYTISNAYKNEIECIYSDFNSNKLIFRIRIKNILSNKKIKEISKSLDQSDDIYKLQSIQESILNNVILRGVKNISKVNLRKLQNTLVKEADKYDVKEIFVLDTVGTNLSNILSYNTIDANRTISNDIKEVYKTLGIEAARQTIYNELLDVIEYDGTYINSHHIGLLCDRMCATIKLVSMFRHGINNDNIGPIAQASFEETPEMFFRAARHAQLDNMTGVSANIMCGQEGNFGTSSFQLYIDMDKIKETKAKQIIKEDNIENEFDLEDEKEECSKSNIAIQSVINTISQKDTGFIENKFDLDI